MSRRVELLEWSIEDNGEVFKPSGEFATFLRFGEEFEEFESGPGNSTVAIVETRDGHVKIVRPEAIRFMDDENGALTNALGDQIVKCLHKRIPKVEIQKYLVASTAHVTPEEMKLLTGQGRLSVDQFEFGTSIYLPPEETVPEVASGLRREGYSDAFISLLQLARDRGCQYLKLDQDGPILEGYTTYDW